MNKILQILAIVILVFSCKNKEPEKLDPTTKNEFEELITEDYVLRKPLENANAVLVLFGGYPENAEDIQREFTINKEAQDNNIAVLYMNYNQKLWLTENEKTKLTEKLQEIFEVNKLEIDNIYIGGFSSGGNVALLLSNFITSQHLNITPKGVFIVDSPVDLAELYTIAEKNVERNFSASAIAESSWIIETFNEHLGNPNATLSKYEAYSVFTSKTNAIDNIKDLKHSNLRFYTEPDTIWWKENSLSEYEEMNAYHIKQLYETLRASNFDNVDYITTKNKGYRANGERHPHSWSIVDKKELIKWMLAYNNKK